MRNRVLGGETLDHVARIQKFIEAICRDSDVHALIIEGPPGWGKTTAVEEALRLAGVKSCHLGPYSTPLNLYNFLSEHASEVVLMDDVSGVFSDQSAMALLKAATWPSREGRRSLRWGSTSTKAAVSEFDFFGKLVIVCNSFPKTPDGVAVSSRSFPMRIDVTVNEAIRLLRRAAQDTRHFSKPDLAQQVAEFLIERLNESTLPQISFRTLRKGYRLAEVHADSWQELFLAILPARNLEPEVLVYELAQGDLPVKEQARIFQERSGLGLRSFYNYRKNGSLSRTLKN